MTSEPRSRDRTDEMLPFASNGKMTINSKTSAIAYSIVKKHKTFYLTYTMKCGQRKRNFKNKNPQTRVIISEAYTSSVRKTDQGTDPRQHIVFDNG